MGVRRHLWAWKSYLVFLLAPIVLSPLVISLGTRESKCAYVVILMGTYWISECLPVGVTALLPVVLFPVFQIMSTQDAANEYMNGSMMLLIGGLMAAMLIEYWNVHKRLALRIVTIMGSEPRWLMLGLMLSTWFMSMWISNTASTAMMVPITEAILQEIRDTDTQDDPALKSQDTVAKLCSNHEDEVGEGAEFQAIGDKQNIVQEKQEMDEMMIQVDFSESRKSPNAPNSEDLQNEHTSLPKPASHPEDPHADNLAKGLLLCICYSANCGGIASLTGTGSNLILKKEVDELYESNGMDTPVNFGNWFLLGIPLSMCVMLIVWVTLQVLFLKCRPSCMCRKETPPQELARKRRVEKIIQSQYDALGTMVFPQILACVLFAIMVVLWVTRDLGGVVGWGKEFEIPVKSGSVAVLFSILGFGLPSTFPFLKSYPNTYHPDTDPDLARLGSDGHRAQTDQIKIRPLLQWKFVAQRFPWAVILLVGGGFCISAGCKVSGLSAWIGHKLTYFHDWDQYVVLIVICYFSSVATEFASNFAIASIMLPIIQRLAISTHVHPLKYMLAECFSCAFSYMLPVAQPPNAIVFGTGRIKITDMMKAGITVNLLAVPMLIILLTSLGNVIYGLEDIPHQFLNTTVTSLSHSKIY